LLLLPQLTLRQQQILVLVVLCDLKKSEVAEILGISRAAVSQHIGAIQARARLLVMREAA